MRPILEGRADQRRQSIDRRRDAGCGEVGQIDGHRAFFCGQRAHERHVVILRRELVAIDRQVGEMVRPLRRRPVENHGSDAIAILFRRIDLHHRLSAGQGRQFATVYEDVGRRSLRLQPRRHGPVDADATQLVAPIDPERLTVGLPHRPVRETRQRLAAQAQSVPERVVIRHRGRKVAALRQTERPSIGRRAELGHDPKRGTFDVHAGQC